MKKSILIFASLFLGIQVFAQSRPDALKLYRERNYKEAISVCEDEIKRVPNNLDSHAVLCWSLVGNKQYAEAEQRAMEARKISSTDIRLMEVLGEAKYYLGKNNEALTMFQKYIASSNEKAPRLGAAYYYMGEIYIRQKKYNHADISFSMAVRAEPLRDFWWTRLGYAREMAGEYGSAVTAYDKALSLNASQYDATRGKQRCATHL